MKYYETLPTHTEAPRNTTLKIANLYIEFNHHFLTLQKKIPLLLNRSVHITHNAGTTTALWPRPFANHLFAYRNIFPVFYMFW